MGTENTLLPLGFLTELVSHQGAILAITYKLTRGFRLDSDEIASARQHMQGLREILADLDAMCDAMELAGPCPPPTRANARKKEEK